MNLKRDSWMIDSGKYWIKFLIRKMLSQWSTEMHLNFSKRCLKASKILIKEKRSSSNSSTEKRKSSQIFFSTQRTRTNTDSYSLKKDKKKNQNMTPNFTFMKKRKSLTPKSLKILFQGWTFLKKWKTTILCW